MTRTREVDAPSGLRPPQPLIDRYSPKDLSVFTDAERARFLPGLTDEELTRASTDPKTWQRIAEDVAWEILYRREPLLFDRLVSGERIHPAVVGALGRAKVAVDIGAGTGRMTLALAAIADEVIAVEPAEAMRALLSERTADNIDIRDGFFDELPVDDNTADLVVTCSAFTPHDAHGGETGLAEMERVCAPGGRIAVVWPTDERWLADRGFEIVRFKGPLAVDFGTPEEAVDLSAIFYPEALEEVAAARSALVPYEVLGMQPPNCVAIRVLPAAAG